MSERDPDRQRLDELLAQRAVGGLDAEERRELASLREICPDTDEDAFERVAADLDLALGAHSSTPLPPALDARVARDAAEFFAGADGSTRSLRPAAAGARGAPPRRRRSWQPAAVAGWFVATAALAVLISSRIVPVAPPDARSSRAALLSRGEPVVELAWQPTEDPAASSLEGDVVWSDARGEGFMRFRGLAPNDPAVRQYQLWIFDAERDERFPVDGGVFDVPSGAEEVVVPIRAKLGVDRANLFAVTIERPGGVVVSDRERVVALASVGEG